MTLPIDVGEHQSTTITALSYYYHYCFIFYNLVANYQHHFEGSFSLVVIYILTLTLSEFDTTLTHLPQNLSLYLICAILITYIIIIIINTVVIKYSNELVFKSEKNEGCKNDFRKLKVFESMALRVKPGKIIIMVSGSITKNDLSKSNVYPCGVC